MAVWRALFAGIALTAFESSVAHAAGGLDGPPHYLAGPSDCECAGPHAEQSVAGRPWHWELLPAGLIYRSYLAGVKEPRMYLGVNGYKDAEWFVDTTIGGRVGLVRYGNGSDLAPEGYQLDIEAAGQGRLNVNDDVDLTALDMRAGFVLSHRMGDARIKLAYYHLSSHVGDEFLINHPDFHRINYSREALILGFCYFITSAVMPYIEVEWGPRVDGGSEPWGFQLGVDVSPAPVGWAPFAAVNGYLRQEVDFSGNFVAQTGIQYRRALGQRLRFGLQYVTGMNTQFSFFQTPERSGGFGIWYDF